MGNFIGKILSENNGDLSSMRVLVFFVIAVFLFNWTWLNIQTGSIISFDWQEVSVIVGTLFAKAYQKGKEKNE